MLVSKINLNISFLRRLALLTPVWLTSVHGTILVLKILGITGEAYSSLIINVVFLLISFGYIRLYGLTAGDIGLKIFPQRLASHVNLSLALFAMYWLYYLSVVRILGLRPFTPATVWGLLNYLLVAFAEEIYFRGLWYHIVDKQFSGRAAVLISGLIFGLSHYQQGLGMLPRFFTGWLWGSIRYATGMITLLIPIHFTYNAVWLLFQGNWDHLPPLAYVFPLLELLIAILIVARFTYITNHRKLKIHLEENL